MNLWELLNDEMKAELGAGSMTHYQEFSIMPKKCGDTTVGWEIRIFSADSDEDANLVFTLYSNGRVSLDMDWQAEVTVSRRTTV